MLISIVVWPISAARNAGLAAARAPLIALMDSDDIAFPNRLGKQYAFMQANPQVTVCSTNAIKVFPDGQRVAMSYPVTDGVIKARLIIVESSLLNPTVMFRRDFVKSKGIFYDSNFRIDEDHKFFAEMMLHGAQFQCLPELLLLYRRHQNNFTNNQQNALDNCAFTRTIGTSKNSQRGKFKGNSIIKFLI